MPWRKANIRVGVRVWVRLRASASVRVRAAVTRFNASIGSGRCSEQGRCTSAFPRWHSTGGPTHLGVCELETVRGADDDDAVVAADDLPLPQLRQRRQRHTCTARTSRHIM